MAKGSGIPVMVKEDEQLIAIAMCIPNSEGIYQPSRLTPALDICLLPWARPIHRNVKVSFAPDGVSDPKLIDVYGFSFLGYFIRASEVTS